MLTFTIAEEEERMVLELSIKEAKIGFATLDNDADILHLRWIEVVDNYKSQGMSTQILSYITDNILKNDQDFHISVVNEEVLPFYIKFFEKKNFARKRILDWIQDGDIHPEIYVEKGILTKITSSKLKMNI
ncbi:MAG: hypothetical protein HYX61_08705 [Gammaproteobacteria bacterium]|jgi:hypothetical protein|nr:hypothetical protein [Gammaproteobacteria bacterium]